MSGFWSNRKAAVAAEAEVEVEAQLEVEREAREAELEEKSDEEILAQLELPDPDTLGEGDNFKVFLTEAVPARIRIRALRRLWLTNPVLANVDGLVDYGEDFTDAKLVVENMQTAYQVGKGMLKHVEEMARQAAEKETAPDEAVADGPAEETKDEVIALVEEAEEDMVSAEADETSETPLPEFEEAHAFAPTPRRMRFSFASETTGATS